MTASLKKANQFLINENNIKANDRFEYTERKIKQANEEKTVAILTINENLAKFEEKRILYNKEKKLFKAELLKITEEKETLLFENKNCNTEQMAKKELILNFEKNLAKLQLSDEKLNNKVKYLNLKLATTNQENKSLHAKNEKLQASNDNISSELSTIKEKLKIMSESISEKRSEIEKLSIALKSQISNVNTQLMEEKNLREHLEFEKKRLEMMVTQLNKSILEVRVERDESIAKVETFESKIVNERHEMEEKVMAETMKLLELEAKIIRLEAVSREKDGLELKLKNMQKLMTSELEAMKMGMESLSSVNNQAI